LVKNPLGRASASSGNKTKQAGLTAVPACLLCFVLNTSARSSMWIFVAATNSTNKTKEGFQCMPFISLFFDLMSMAPARVTRLGGFSPIRLLFVGSLKK
jgi:hypothetical protein